jgi:Arc/MetJ family transcription regulator
MVGVIAIAKQKTSFEIDTEKLKAAKEILGMRTMTETVDAALDEVVKRQQRRELLDLLFDSDQLELDNPEVMRAAWRREGEA